MASLGCLAPRGLVGVSMNESVSVKGRGCVRPQQEGCHVNSVPGDIREDTSSQRVSRGHRSQPAHPAVFGACVTPPGPHLGVKRLQQEEARLPHDLPAVLSALSHLPEFKWKENLTQDPSLCLNST